MTTTISNDLRQAARRLARAPGFTALAVVTLALGVGAHTAVFRWADAVLRQPLPVPEPERLVGIYETRDGAGFHPLSLPDATAHGRAAKSFSGTAAHYPVAPLILELEDGTQKEVIGSVVSPGYFPVLGLEPARGRFFRPEEAGPPGGHPVAVVSRAFWRDRLGGREDVLGAPLRLNDTDFTVVGVVGDGFRGLRPGHPPEVWIPTSMASVGYRWCEASDRDCRWVEMVGRLAPGLTLAEARVELDWLARRMQAARPAGGGVVRGLAVAPLDGVHPRDRGRMLRLSGVLATAVTLVLLVAAANLAGLLIARNVSRRRETATRLALGAPRRRVIRECLAESALLALAGSAASLPVAAWLVRILGGIHGGEAPVVVGLDAASLAYAAALALAGGALAGLVVGIEGSRSSLVAALKDDPTAGRHRRPRLLGGLVVAQVTLSFVLVASAGLLVRSVESAEGLGAVEPDRIATLRLRPRLVDYDAERARRFTREALRRLEAVPGVEMVTVGRVLPPWGGVEATPEGPAVVEVGQRFFETFGFPFLGGRSFEQGDAAGSPPVTVVNRAFAEARWPEGEPLGRLLEIGDRRFEVVGVVEDTAYRSLVEARPFIAYTPYWQDPALVDARVGVRTAGDAEDLLPALRSAVRAVDRAVPVTEAETFAARLDRLLSPVHLAQRVLGASALVSVVLSAIGLYGVLSLAVARRTRDIGVRMALGGTRSRVVALVVWEALGLVATALALGSVVALFTGRGLAHHLYGVGAADAYTFAATLAVFAVVAALAVWWPARRAARVDPARVLHRP